MPTDCHCAGAWEGLHSSECGYYRPPVRETLGEAVGRKQMQNVRDPEAQLSYQSSLAKNLLSTLEAWSRTPKDHRAETPTRFVKALEQLTTREDFKFTTFPNEGPDRVDEMIVLAPIPFYTLCAHHVVPFFGHAYIGYIPGDSIAGLSKFARAVKWCAKGFWVQETLTKDIADYLEEHLAPQGVAVVLKAEHMCMAMRGVETAGVLTTTSVMRGVFSDHNRTAKAEFLDAIRGAK